MHVFAYGLNHRTADVDLRGRVAYPSSEVLKALGEVQSCLADLRELAILSTCNRTEFHGVSSSQDIIGPLAQWITQTKSVELSELNRSAYIKWDNDAFTHMVRVAAGLDSQVIGEPQIFGQYKHAISSAKESGALGTELVLLSNFVIQSAKRIRSETAIGQNPVSVAYAAMKLVEQVWAKIDNTNVLIIGAGDQAELLGQQLAKHHPKSITIANRTAQRSALVAAKLAANVMPFSEIADSLARFDLIVSATSSNSPVLTRDMFERASQARRSQPILILDLAVPRDVEPSVNELNNVYLHTIDSLTGVIEDSLKKRRVAAAEAEAYVAESAEQYQAEKRVRRVSTTIQSYRENVEETRLEILARAKSDIESGQEINAVLDRLSVQLTNQLAHRPTMLLRQMGDYHNPEIKATIQRLLVDKSE